MDASGASKIASLLEKVKKLTMTKRAKEPAIYFERPTVTARVYSAKGPSGWLETFPRKELDRQLTAFLGAAPVDAVVAMFIAQRELSDRITTWETVVGFLGRLLDVHPFSVPPEVGLAFWGHVVLAVREQGAN